MSVVEAFDPNEIRLSDNAVSKVRTLVEDEGNPGLKLRVYITGGGCSGFQYGFSFDEAVSDDDMVVERDGVTALIDAMSYQYLVGSEVDYSEGLEGSRFVVNNPNATTTCGCGASFSICLFWLRSRVGRERVASPPLPADPEIHLRGVNAS